MTDVEVAFRAAAVLGEGPMWDERRREVVWVDIDRGAVHFRGLDGSTEATFDVGQPVSVVVPRERGGYVLAVRDGLALLDKDRYSVSPLPIIEPQPTTRMNDGKCDPRGRLWVGSMSTTGTEGAGSLYRIDADHEAHTVLRSVTISNGIGWSTDARTMYHVDTHTGGIDAFDYDADSGLIRWRRRLVDVHWQDGKPDGLAMDTDGCLWVALWGGWAVHRYTPDGRLDRRVSLPVAQVTSCCFVGRDLDTLVITSASRGLDDRDRARQPHAGDVFACWPGAVGLSVARYRG